MASERGLIKLGLSALIGRSLTEKIDHKQVMDMTDKDLTNLGIVTISDRIRLKALVKLNAQWQVTHF